MDSPRLTPAAARALNLSAKLATAESAPAVAPVHLLWALSLQESRASEILAERQLSPETLRRVAPIATGEALLPAIEEADEDGPYVPLDSHCRQIVELAARHVAGIDRQGEVGSEHLLWGLTAVDSPIGRLLAQHGLNGESMAARARASSGLTVEPLEVNFELEAADSVRNDETDVLRIVDAAANRAREGLRVLEDYARFAADDARQSERLKQCRHSIADAVQRFDPRGLLRSRDTPNDVGTSIHTVQEATRTSVQAVLLANFKRTQEALRTLEEFGKLLDGRAAEPLGQVRYELYSLERELLLAHDLAARLAGCHLYLLATSAACRGGVERTIKEAMDGGVRILQVREKQMADRELLQLLRQIRGWTRAADVLLIVNDRPDLAALCDADGVHVGQEELTVRDARRIVGSDRLVGVSTHSIEQARAAVSAGADYLGVGPTFPSRTKAFDGFAGLEFVSQVATEIRLPWFAIGGIDEKNVDEVVAAGASRVAVSHAICAATSPRDTARRLARLIQV